MSHKYEFKLIAIEQLTTVDYNPNEMSESQLSHLKKTIKERGFMQPLTVTPKIGEENHYVVIDGMHRLEVYKELGKNSIPCYIVPDKTDLDIKVDLVNLNKIKGEFNPDKYAVLLNAIEADTGQAKMQELLNLEDEEYAAYKELLAQETDNLSKKPVDEGTEVSFTVKDLKCPSCGYKGPKKDFKIKET